MNAGPVLAKIGLVLCGLLLLDPLHAGKDDYRDPLAALYDRSDLVVEATVTESVDGGMAGGSLGFLPRLGYIQCVTRVSIDRVLKGDLPAGGPLPLAVTLPQADLKTAWKPDREVIVPAPINQPVFTARSGEEPPPPLLKKGDRYIFFLEDRHKREPGSTHFVGGEDIRFRTFDLWFGRFPPTDALIVQLERMHKGVTPSP